MPTADLLERNRLIFCHFDSYSTALRFVRINDSVMLPASLPENSSMVAAPTETGDTPTDVLLQFRFTSPASRHLKPHTRQSPPTMAFSSPSVSCGACR